jgi:hypothetical protein
MDKSDSHTFIYFIKIVTLCPPCVIIRNIHVYSITLNNFPREKQEQINQWVGINIKNVLKYVKSLPECHGLQIHSHQVSANRLP